MYFRNLKGVSDCYHQGLTECSVVGEYRRFGETAFLLFKG